MAVKKSKSEPAAPKASEPQVVAEKTVATKAATRARTAAPVAVASNTASKAATPKPTPAAARSAAPKAAAKKPAAAPVKLTDRQVDFLKQILDARDSGYLLAKKAEQKTLDALFTRKLIKKGAKDKASGNYRYTVSKAGEKHLSSLPPA